MKIEKLAYSRSISASEIVRLAIDAYEPDPMNERVALKLTLLVHKNLKETILSTKKTNKKIADVLALLRKA